VRNINNQTKVQSGEIPAVKWGTADNKKEAIKKLNNQEYYAAFIFPKDFSEKQVSFQTLKGKAPKVQIVINQGMNTMGVDAATQIVEEVMGKINNNTRSELLVGLEKQGGKLQPKQALSLVEPIQKEVTHINTIGTYSANGNAPVSLFQPLWMTSLIGAAIVFITIRNLHAEKKRQLLLLRGMQVLIGVVLSLVSGFSIVWIASDWLNLTIPSFIDTALFITISYLCYYLMVSAVMSWIGFGALPIFVILLFFSTPLLTMAPEFMPSFYQKYIYSWIPMRFSVDGLRELVFFGRRIHVNHETSVLISIGLTSLMVLGLSVLKKRKSKEQENIAKESTEANC
jgi:hypothetical protein